MKEGLRFSSCFLIFYLFLIIGCRFAYSATYYTMIDGDDGSSCADAQRPDTAKRTIIGGKSCLRSPGDLLIVGDGRYVEGEIRLSVSGTAEQPITIRAQNKLGAILSSVSGGTCSPNISFYGSYLVVDGIRGEINESDPYCAPNSATGAFVRMWGISVPSKQGPLTTGNVGGVVRNCQIDAHPNRSVGIKTNQDDSVVENCVVHSSLEAFNGNNQIFRNNLVDTGDAWKSIFTSKGGARNTQFYNNTIRKSGGWRALTLGGRSSGWFWDSETQVECFNCVAFNNVVIVDEGDGSNAVSMTGCSNCALFNNVFIGASLLLDRGASLSIPGPYPASVNPIVKNNVFSCRGAAAFNKSSVFEGMLDVDYNLFFECVDAPAQQHAVIGDPRFLNVESDWRTQPDSPVVNAGERVEFPGYGGQLIDVSRDRGGVPRGVPWGLGIYTKAPVDGGSDSRPLAPTDVRVSDSESKVMHLISLRDSRAQ